MWEEEVIGRVVTHGSLSMLARGFLFLSCACWEAGRVALSFSCEEMVETEGEARLSNFLAASSCLASGVVCEYYSRP